MTLALESSCFNTGTTATLALTACLLTAKRSLKRRGTSVQRRRAGRYPYVGYRYPYTLVPAISTQILPWQEALLTHAALMNGFSPWLRFRVRDSDPAFLSAADALPGFQILPRTCVHEKGSNQLS